MEIRITEADIKNCQPYIPIMDKTMAIINAASICMSEDQIRGNDGQPLPSMWQENKNMTSRVMMGFLATLLGKDFDPAIVKNDAGVVIEGTQYLMSADEYDAWASAHAVNQVERYKSNPELRDKCFDILYEYREIEKWLRAEIRANLEAMNDLVTRGGELLRSSLTPQAMQNITDNMTEIGKMADELTERRRQKNLQ